MLYERARQLKSGSLGEGPQVHPDPTQKPLALMSRVANSRGLRVVGFTVAVVGLAGIVYAGWVAVSFLLALFGGR